MALIYTPGEPAGIGPDLIVQWAQAPQPWPVWVVADPRLLVQRAHCLGLPLSVQICEQPPHRAASPGCLFVKPCALSQPAQAGRLDMANAAYVLETLRMAAQACLDGQARALVTGPVHKGIINEAGMAFSGHTEFLAAHTQGFPVMMLACPGLRVALVTTHLPLANVSAHITPTRLERVLNVLHHDLQQRFEIARPHILVCGLNPHAGEGGHLGHEEQQIIIPVLEKLRARGMDLEGPLPADSLFQPRYLERADVVLAMYHDQGLPVLKYKGFGQSVNITLGLPIVRTSVDHGTALALAGTGQASLGSLQAALEMAWRLTRNRA